VPLPWRHTSPLDHKTPVIADDLRDRLALTERCARSSVRRTPGDKGGDRDLTPGPQGLAARSRRPRTAPRHTPDSGVAALRDARPRPPSWGAKQLVSLRRTRQPRWPWPARATVCDLLCRDACTQARPPEALDRLTPAAYEAPAARQMPPQLPPLAGPDRFAVRDVRAHGGLRWRHQGGNVSHVCGGDSVGRAESDEGVWEVSFGPLTLGRRLERHRRSEEASGRVKRHR
jgi:hypothetical protein